MLIQSPLKEMDDEHFTFFMMVLLSLYSGENQDSEESSDSEFVSIPSHPFFSLHLWYTVETNSLLQDNDLYEEPQGDYNYEPPPSEKVFTPPRSVNYTGGEYLGKFCYHVIMISWSQTSRSC